MGPENLAKLRREIEARGFIAPLLVRPQGERFEIVDGEHRFRIAQELGVVKVPCVVAELSEREARIKTLQLNGLRGENEPDRLAALLTELAADLDPNELERLLPWSAQEMEQMIAMLAATPPPAELDGLSGLSMPVPDQELYAVVVTRSEREDIERGLQKVRAQKWCASEGAALAEICRSYGGRS